ncbi:MAG: hypothetical protein A3I05_06390 [Deltaproteobacteria bacterium RIFCSPLOWO2_02_FULL_44_10]|nr:MAG: hypothetical protein A3C46_01675 [Deltaproteobacteria bacterium RIFCSPHIGHO2_02_FULL_44_16]OGQ46444.1 MAG: hypothetical protein A3I05_06390 [Deltaproteobacteria bacterium RIFCSPLOWO2_02_FULL_44_10]
MLLIPLIYLKDGKAMRLEQSALSLFQEDIVAMAKNLQSAGIDTLFIIDLNFSHTGTSPHLPLIQQIIEQGSKVILGGNARSIQSITPYIESGVEQVVFGSTAYQHPKLVQEACEIFPEKIAAHIDVKAGRVVVPGWTVAANKTALDYVERFRDYGMKTIFYSDVNADEKLSPDNFESTLQFCKKAKMHVFITSEISEASDVEHFVTLGAPHLKALVLTKAFYKQLIDVKASLSLISDLLVDATNDTTLMEE